MRNEQDFNNELDAIMAIPEQKIKIPGMPMTNYLLEADNLEHWIPQDRDRLLTAGLNPQFMDTLPARINACRVAQARWVNERKLLKDVQVHWKEQAPQAYELRDQLLRAFRFAFRKEPYLMEVVNDIAEGNTHADMIQDLITLTVLGRENMKYLKAINFDFSLLEKADTWATELGDLLAKANGDRKDGNEGKILRDRAYTHLKEAIDEIRDYGKYLFWGNERRQQGYFSEYTQKRGANYRSKKAELEQES